MVFEFSAGRELIASAGAWRGVERDELNSSAVAVVRSRDRGDGWARGKRPDAEEPRSRRRRGSGDAAPSRRE
jgi:hypothetical protein